MKPLNQPERRTRLWQFSLFYLLALLVPLVASYYLFSNSSIADENARLKRESDRTHEEQTRLVTRFDTLTQHLKRIDATDTKITKETNPNELSLLALKNQDYGNAIAARLSELRSDTVQLQTAAHRLLARNVLRDFDYYRTTRNTIDVLRQAATKSGPDAARITTLQSEVNNAKQEAAASKTQVIALQAALAGCGKGPANPPPSGGGGGEAAKLQIEVLKDQVAMAKADCLRQRALEHKRKSRERRQLLESSRTEFIQILQAPATADIKASIEQTLGPINVELGREPGFFGFLK